MSLIERGVRGFSGEFLPQANDPTITSKRYGFRLTAQKIPPSPPNPPSGQSASARRDVRPPKPVSLTRAGARHAAEPGLQEVRVVTGLPHHSLGPTHSVIRRGYGRGFRCPPRRGALDRLSSDVASILIVRGGPHWRGEHRSSASVGRPAKYNTEREYAGRGSLCSRAINRPGCRAGAVERGNHHASFGNWHGGSHVVDWLCRPGSGQ